MHSSNNTYRGRLIGPLHCFLPVEPSLKRKDDREGQKKEGTISLFDSRKDEGDDLGELMVPDEEGIFDENLN